MILNIYEKNRDHVRGPVDRFGYGKKTPSIEVKVLSLAGGIKKGRMFFHFSCTRTKAVTGGREEEGIEKENENISWETVSEDEE